MKKGRGWIVAGVLLLGVVAAAPLMMGQGIESTVKGVVDKSLTGPTSLLAQNGLNSYVKVSEHTYSRGALDSSETLKVDLGCPGQQSTRLEFKNRIQHCPFPGFNSMGLASVDTELVLPAPVQSQLDRAFGGQKWKVHTLVNFDGSSTSTLNLPAGSVDQDGTRMEWQAGSGQVRSSGGGTSGVYSLNFPKAVVTTANSEGVTLENLRLEGNTQQLKDYKNLTQASQKASLGRMSFKAGGQTVALENLNLDTGSRIQGDDSGFDFALQAGKLSFNKQSVSDITLKLGMDKLKAASLEQLMGASSSLTSNVCNPSSVDPTSLGLKLISPLLELLQGGPRLRVDRFAFKVPEGETVLSGSAEFADAASVNLTNFSTAALEQLKAKLSFSSSQKALSSIVTAFGGAADSVEQGLVSFEQGGFIKKSGDALSSELKFENKKLTVNGQEIPLGL